MEKERFVTFAGARANVFVTAKAKAFSGEGVREHRFLVKADGTVRVWDSVANHYTTCHSLSRAAENRIRKLAEK